MGKSSAGPLQNQRKKKRIIMKPRSKQAKESVYVTVRPQHIACSTKACSKGCVISQAGLDLGGIRATDTNYSRFQTWAFNGESISYSIPAKVLAAIKNFDKTGLWPEDLTDTPIEFGPISHSLRREVLRKKAAHNRAQEKIQKILGVEAGEVAKRVSPATVAACLAATKGGPRLVKSILRQLQETPARNFSKMHDSYASTGSRVKATRAHTSAVLKGVALQDKIQAEGV
jgi:hypothetical protein